MFPRRLTTGLPALVLALVFAFSACNNGSDATTTPAPADGSPAADATATPAPSGDGGVDLDAVQVVEELTPSVVHILSEAATFDVFGQITPQRGVGTGFIIDPDGYIVTNNHVVTIDGGQPAEDITVTLADGRQFSAEIVGRDPPTDVAVLRIDADGLPTATLGSSGDLQVGDDVLAIGNALDLEGGPTVTRGVVSAKGRLIQAEAITIPDAIQTDASINPGNSGGPLVNGDGEVVGITTAVIRGEAEGIGLVIAIDSAKPIIDELIADGVVDRGFLGITIAEITPSLAERFDLAVDRGIGVQAVELGSPAEDAGLVVGDIIVSLGDDETDNSGELFRALTQHRAGETVTVVYYRDGLEETTELTLG